MALRAWDVHDQIANALLVIARSRRSAIKLGVEHLASFGHPYRTKLTAIERRPALGGRSRAQLLAAIDAGVPGIGHRQVGGSWVVLPPGDHSGRAVRPRPTEVFFYNNDLDYEVVLFAFDEERADLLYDAIQADHGVLPSVWLGSEWSAWLITGLVRHKKQVEERGVEGLGIYGPDGREILPLDYDAIGVPPPDP